MNRWSQLEWYRCPSPRCHKKLARLRLAPGSAVEFKCPYCNAYSIQDGSDAPRLIEVAVPA